MLKNAENNGTEEFGLVTLTTGLVNWFEIQHEYLISDYSMFIF